MEGVLFLVPSEVLRFKSVYERDRVSLMYFRPVLRAFSESTLPYHRPPSGLEKALRNRHHSCVVSIRHLHLLGPVIETGESRHAISAGSIKSWRRARNARLSPFALPSSVWTRMSLSSSSAANTVQNSDSAVDPASVEEVLGANVFESSREDVIVQYIVIRKDLVEGLNWPLGSVISQGCHAAVAAIWLHKDDPVTLQYCATENLDNMTKVTLEVKGEAQLRALAQKLEIGGIVHKLWIELPENYATCLATKPYPKSEVASYFKKLKLCK